MSSDTNSRASYSAYDSTAMRQLSMAISEVIAEFEARREPLDQARKLEISEKITAVLMNAYDGGERDRIVLKRLGGKALAAEGRFKTVTDHPLRH